MKKSEAEALLRLLKEVGVCKYFDLQNLITKFDLTLQMLMYML